MKRARLDLNGAFEELAKTKPAFRKTTNREEKLDIDYVLLLRKGIADELMRQLEYTVEYYEGDLTKVKVYGKWHEIPRQQGAYGDDGIKYTFSGITVEAKPWKPCLFAIKQLIQCITGFQYNFVLVNRYRNGSDHIGEHRDDERELDRNTPIASLSLGQQRQFVLRHKDARKKDKRRNISTVKIDLQHGSLLMMNPPTNQYWYYSLPARKTATGVRINLTFRKINM